MPRRPVITVLVLVLPPLVVGFAYDKFLGHRSDYLGHFLAGFGGTLGAVAVILGLLSVAVASTGAEAPLTRPSARLLSPRSGTRGTALAAYGPRGWTVLIVVLACIGLGAIFEEKLYHLAKWDEVDFCNQSMGAVLAGLAALASQRSLESPTHSTVGHHHSAEQRDEFERRASLSIRPTLIWAVAAGTWGAIVLKGGYYFAFR